MRIRLNNLGSDAFEIDIIFFLLNQLTAFNGLFMSLLLRRCLGFLVSFSRMGLDEVLSNLLCRIFISVSILSVKAFFSYFLYLQDLFKGCLISRNSSLRIACLKY